MTETRPRQLGREPFLARLRELIDEGADRSEIAERMRPLLNMSVSEEYMHDAIEAISGALEIAHELRNQAMAQANKDFINRERYATEFDGVAASTRAHIATAYRDATIREAKLVELEAEQKRRRSMATEAAEDWTRLQARRIRLDDARKFYPTAFIDFNDWQP